MKRLLFGLCALAACDGAADPAPGERDPRFVGLWQVDQPAHAGYEATYYTFAADGGLAHGDSCTFGGAPLEGYQTGTVGRAAPDVTCQFGARWWSEDSRTLVIEGDCSDGAARPIALGFPTDPAGNAAGVAVEVLAVDGEAGWAHLDFDWRWATCARPEDCPLGCE